MLGTSLFWPSTIPASYQPVFTSVSLRSFSTSRVRHPATSSDDQDEQQAVSRARMHRGIVGHQRLDKTPAARPWFRGELSLATSTCLRASSSVMRPARNAARSLPLTRKITVLSVRGVARHQRVARHVVARRHGQPLVGPEASGPLFSIIASMSASFTSRV